MKRLEDHLRRDAHRPLERHLAVRGTPNDVAKLMKSALRMATQYTFADSRCYGLSMHIVAPDELDELLRSAAYRTRHSYARVRVDVLSVHGFLLLPTFVQANHYTLLLEPYTERRTGELAASLRAATHPNPYWLGRSSR